ncbi:MAG: cytochrome b/b6 domain-containing protein [Halieaceae bacterium]|jgi:cytochrome b|nr:cytochrome b/b6 domain-containing protein [Halieaceae bacterium]
MSDKANPLWDIPTRLCHWLIVVCLPLSWWSAETENYELHEWLGYTVIVLVVSRVAWGFVGSRHSRFGDFLVGPRAIMAYLRGGGAASAGHNPLGGWSVIALLSLLLLQAVSGLFNSDDVFFTGPLYHGASVTVRDFMGGVHELAFDLLLALVALHILAVLYHQYVRKEPLVQAMVRGSASGRRGDAAPVPAWRALLLVLLTGLALWGLLQLAPPPPALMW